MGTKLYLALSVLTALFQGPFLPPVFLEGVLLSVYLAQSKPKPLLSIFASGILFDLFQSQHLGITSLIFLTVVLLTSFLEEHIPVYKILKTVFLAVVINLVRSQIVF